MIRSAALALLLAAAPLLYAQWEIEESHTTASLRGVHSLGGGLAWASGTGGTVLRTRDGGHFWQSCATPPGAETLDFRGIQAFDENTAIVISSGKGDLSRLYRTTDGCRSWTLLLTNPDKDGFWDALAAEDHDHWTILGDPVAGHFVLIRTADAGKTWQHSPTPAAAPEEGAFAASNSSLLIRWPEKVAIFGTGGPSGARLFLQCAHCPPSHQRWYAHPLPLLASGKSAGIFALGSRDWKHWVAVGGDYTQPDATRGTAAYTTDAGQLWHTPLAPPHGYRSSLAFDSKSKTWITVGPNGTDISTDDGRNWRTLKPGPQDPTDADRSWNALSLPFVVGPNGRVGKLRTDALPPAKP